MKKLLIIAVVIGSAILAPHFMMTAVGHSMADMDAACQTACFSLDAGTAIAGEIVAIFAALVFFFLAASAAAVIFPSTRKFDFQALWLSKRRHREFLKTFIMLQ